MPEGETTIEPSGSSEAPPRAPVFSNTKVLIEKTITHLHNNKMSFPSAARLFLCRLRNSSLARNSALVAKGIFGGQIITLAFTPMLTRLYEPEAFGVFAAFIALLNLITPLSSLGYANAIVMARTQDAALAVARLSLLCGILVAFLTTTFVFMFNSQLLSWIGIGTAPGLLYLAPASLLVMALISIANQLAIREGLYKDRAAANIGSTMLMNIGKLSGGFLAPSGLMLIIVSLLGSSLYCLMLFKRLARQDALKAKRWWETSDIRAVAREYRQFAFYRMPLGVIVAASVGLPIILLTKLFGSESAGQYSIIAVVLSGPALLIGQSVSEAFLPEITRMLHKDRARAAGMVWRATMAMCAIAAPLFGIIVLGGSAVFPFVMGPEWGKAGEFSSWVAIDLAGALISRPAIASIPALNKQGHWLIIQIVITALLVSAFYLGAELGDDVMAIKIFSIFNFIGYLALTVWVLMSLSYRPRENKIGGLEGK